MYRVRQDLTGKVDVFLGTKGKPGKNKGQFSFPEGITCDKDGHILVCDTGNNRVQVFSSGGKPIASLSVPAPYQVESHPKTGLVAPSLHYENGTPQFSWSPERGVLGEILQLIRNP